MSTRLLLAIIDLNAGTATFCRALASGLARHCPDQFDVHLLLMRNRGIEPRDRDLFHAIHIAGAPVHDDWRRFHETVLDLFRLKRAIGRTEADVVVSVGTYANLLIPLAAGGRPVITSVHTPLGTHLREARFGRIIRMLLRWRLPRSRVVAPTDALAQELRRDFGARDVQVIPHGVDIDYLAARAEKPPVGLPVQTDYILACGRLTAAKDYPTLLRACAMARDRGLQLPLLILGDGELRDELHGLARELDLSGLVHFLGHCDNPFPFMRRARFLVQASAWEGFGLVLLEAMALGVPIIATDCPSGPAEVLDHGRYGLLVPPGQPAALADAMVELAHSPARREHLASRAHERAEQLSLRNMALHYARLLQRQPSG
jgi:glycosyltransferase involved in cell wall biosynthesis